MQSDTIILVGVNTAESLNLEVAQKISYAGDIELVKLNEVKEIPIFSKEIMEKDGFPNGVVEIYDSFVTAQNIIIVTPEHNGYFSAFFKNIIDWLSLYNKKFFDQKNIILVVATPGKNAGKTLRDFATTTLGFFGPKSVQTFGFTINDETGVEIDVQEVLDYLWTLKN